MDEKADNKSRDLTPDEKSYRNILISLEQEAYKSYDKAVLTLSAGALGLSSAFAKDFLNDKSIKFYDALLDAWWCWAISLTVMLISFLFSQFALRKTINQLDNHKIYSERPGGYYTIIVYTLNFIGGFFFILGVYFFLEFIPTDMR